MNSGPFYYHGAAVYANKAVGHVGKNVELSCLRKIILHGNLLCIEGCFLSSILTVGALNNSGIKRGEKWRSFNVENLNEPWRKAYGGSSFKFPSKMRTIKHHRNYNHFPRGLSAGAEMNKCDCYSGYC